MEVPFPTTWNIFWARTFLSSPPTHGGGALRVCLWTSSLPLPPLDKFLAAHLSFEDTILRQASWTFRHVSHGEIQSRPTSSFLRTPLIIW